MGWFSSDKSASQQMEPSKDGGYIAPDRTARAQCWEGRDNFFKCLDRHEIIDSVKEDEKARKVCAPELREFERVCQGSWVSRHAAVDRMGEASQELEKCDAGGEEIA